MEDKNNYEVLVYKSPSPHLISSHAGAIRRVLLNGLVVKEEVSSLIVNPESGYFTFNFTPPDQFAYTPQEESEARHQLDNIMSVLAESMKNYVRAGLLPEALGELFTAGYFRQTTLLPIVDEAKGKVVQKWSAQFVVELDATQNKADRIKTKALLNEGFSLVFGNDVILQLQYFHLPLHKGAREKLIATENSLGKQKTEIYYARNGDYTVLPFFISDEGLLPASRMSVLFDRKTQDTSARSQQFPREAKSGFAELPLVAYSPEAEQYMLLQEEFGDDMDCLEVAFHLGFISFCNRIRGAVWEFNVLMDEDARGDSASEMITKEAMSQLLGKLAESFGMVGQIGLTLFSLMQSDLFLVSRNSDELELRQLNELWVNRVEEMSKNFDTRRKMYKRFLADTGYSSAQDPTRTSNIYARLLQMANGTGGMEGLPTEIDVQRQLLQAFVAKGEDGTTGYIHMYLSCSFQNGQYRYRSYEGSWGKYQPTIENVRRVQKVIDAVNKLWPGHPIISLPFEVRLVVYTVEETKEHVKYPEGWVEPTPPGIKLKPDKWDKLRKTPLHDLSDIRVSNLIAG